MFKVLLRGMTSWSAGFARYLDLALGCCLLVLAGLWLSPWLGAFGALSLATFVFDLNGRIQRWTMKSALSRGKGR